MHTRKPFYLIYAKYLEEFNDINWLLYRVEVCPIVQEVERELNKTTLEIKRFC